MEKRYPPGGVRGLPHPPAVAPCLGNAKDALGVGEVVTAGLSLPGFHAVGAVVAVALLKRRKDNNEAQGAVTEAGESYMVIRHVDI